jgi:hypothetical protein
MKDMNERPGLMEKRTDVMDNLNTFPNIDKMTFRMQGRYNGVETPTFNTKNIKYAKCKAAKGGMNVFDADYLNQVNRKRLVDLDYITN